MKTVFQEACVDAINFLCAPWGRLKDKIWLTKDSEIDEDLSLDSGLTEAERIIAEAAASFFDEENTLSLRKIMSLDDSDYERLLLSFKIVRRTSELAEVSEGDTVRTITYRKIMALAERRGLHPQLFEDIHFPGSPFIKELIPFCGEELKVVSVGSDGSLELNCGGEEWVWPREWIAGKTS